MLKGVIYKFSESKKCKKEELLSWMLMMMRTMEGKIGKT